MVRSISNRLKGSKFGISPHYPQEVLERRNKLIPIMLKERKNNQKAYIAGDKLYVNGELWKQQESAENDTQHHKDVLNVCSLDIPKGLVRKLSDKSFLELINKYDILCLNECWVKCPTYFDLPSYEKKVFISREVQWRSIGTRFVNPPF